MKALVLSGGGAGGAFQIGVLKRLFENGESFNAIYGTSVGALNGAGIAFLGFEKLFEIWMMLRQDLVVSRNWLAYVGLASSIYSSTPLHRMVDKYLVGRPSCEVIVSYVDMMNGSIHYASATRQTLEEFREFVKASAAVPFYMPLVAERYADGGVREHTPLQRAIEDGFRDITVIACNEAETEHHLQGFRPSWPKLVSLGLRANDLLQREVFTNDIRVPPVPGLKISMFSPKKRIIDTFEFDPKKIRAAIAQGYQTEGVKWA